MSLMDDILEKSGLKYEELNSIERETLNTWVDTLQKGRISVNKVKEYIASMKEAVENDLCKHNLSKKKDLFMKARLRNYMLLEAFLSTPEKAKKQMENAVAGMITKKA